MSVATDDPVLKFLESGGHGAPSKSEVDPVEDFLESGNVPVSQVTEQPKSSKESYPLRVLKNHPLVGSAEVAANLATSLGTSAVSGWEVLTKLAKGDLGKPENVKNLSNKIREREEEFVYQPRTEGGQVGQKILSIPGEIIKFAREGVGNLSGKVGAGPGLQTGIETTLDAAANIIPLKMARGSKATQSVSRSEQLGLKEKPKEAIDAKSQTKEIFQEPEKFETKAHPEEQSRRAQVLSRVGIDEARKSSIEGDVKSAASDYQQSKLDNRGGNKMRAVLDSEKEALQGHVDKIIKKNGGSIGMAEDDLHARGNAIASPFDAIRDVLDKATKELYRKADEQAGGLPSVKLEQFGDFLNKDSNFEGKAPNGSLRKGIRAYLKEQDLLNEDGSIKPIKAESAEGLRQYINSQWSPDTSSLAGRIKGLIDKDVLDKAGDTLYGEARALYKKKKDTLENPTGISKLMDYEPNSPINRSVSYEKIPDFVTRLPLDQFEHVVKVLKEAPDELRSNSDLAISEIKSHMLNKIQLEGSKHKGQWNAAGVSKYLNDNKGKIKLIFSEDEIAHLQDLNEAGHILKVDSSYPGAAVQEHNLVTRGAMAGARGLSTAFGATMAGPIGAVIGEAGGTALSSKIGDKGSLSSAQKRLVKISDMVKK